MAPETAVASPRAIRSAVLPQIGLGKGVDFTGYWQQHARRDRLLHLL